MAIRKQKPLIGISIFALLIFFDSIINIAHLADLNRFKQTLAGFSEIEIWGRYLFAWGLRGLWLAAIIGVLVHKEKFRKLLICVSILAILSVYWKFPYAVVLATTEPVFTSMMKNSPTVVTLEKMTWIVISLLYVMDTFFAGCVIFYFTRPKVKKYFK